MWANKIGWRGFELAAYKARKISLLLRMGTWPTVNFALATSGAPKRTPGSPDEQLAFRNSTAHAR